MLLTKEELDLSGQIHPQVTEFYSKNPQPQRKFDVHVYRKMLRYRTEASLARLGPAPADIVEFRHEIQMRDGHASSLKILKPSYGPPGPLIVLCFGGGFVAGDNDQLTETARISVQIFGATVVNISYRVAPEFKFPVQQLDCLDSVLWIDDNATEDILAADPSKGFIMGGVSAGASIAAVLSRRFQGAKLAHPLTGQWLAAPSLMDGKSCPEEYREYFRSHYQNTSTSFSREVLEAMRDAVAWESTSELRHAANSKTCMSKQPRQVLRSRPLPLYTDFVVRTYIQVDGMDPLRDEGLVYDEMLRAAGVQTKLDFYAGCPHCHWLQMRGVEVANKALIDTIVGLGWLLGTKVPRERAAEVLGVPVA